jgi:hypothetical protein
MPKHHPPAVTTGATVATQADSTLVEGSDDGSWPGVDERLWPVLDRVWTGTPWTHACRDLGYMPQKAWAWLQQGGAPSRRAYQAAQRACARTLAESTIGIADDARDKEGADPVRAAQTSIHSRQWLAARQDPETYGDHVAERQAPGTDNSSQVAAALVAIFGGRAKRWAKVIEAEALTDENVASKLV